MTTQRLSRETIVPFIADIFVRRGAESYLGETVSMSEHMLQAAHFAEQSGADDELIAAALLHDIGHYTNEFGEDYIDQGIDNLHDVAGARVLEGFFPPRVVACVRLHVAAKRYLCATDPAYVGKLSAASIATLKLQGGPMSLQEVGEFRRRHFHEEAVRVRLWDEAGKVPGMATPSFDYYAPLLQRVVDRHMAGKGARASS
jgi:phosphonate degradation associated HDIG domain protein